MMDRIWAGRLVWLGLATCTFFIDGFVGLAFTLLLLLTVFIVDRFAFIFLRRSHRFTYYLMIFLSATVIFGVVCLFVFAFVRGADAVATIPRWIMYSAFLYSTAAIGLTLKLDRGARSEQPFQPPPRKASM
jgi:hypothetical protein